VREIPEGKPTRIAFPMTTYNSGFTEIGRISKGFLLENEFGMLRSGSFGRIY
jgi:hypothetical protein